MIVWILITVLITPWFWSLPLPKNSLDINFRKDVEVAKSSVTWQRGKVPSPTLADKLFLNWPTEIVNQRLTIVMENLDIGNYFFAGHPRERVGIVEKQKFFFFQFVLLLIGFTNKKIKKYKKFLVLYSLTALLAVFIFKWRTFEETVFLTIPFIVVMALGLQKIFSWRKKIK